MRHCVGVQALPGMCEARGETRVPADPEHHLSAGGSLKVFGWLLREDIGSHRLKQASRNGKWAIGSWLGVVGVGARLANFTVPADIGNFLPGVLDVGAALEIRVLLLHGGVLQAVVFEHVLELQGLGNTQLSVEVHLVTEHANAFGV